MSQSSYLLIVWLTITVIGLSGMIAALVWAVRSRQFQNQDRASRLPLESGIPSDDEWNASSSMGVPPMCSTGVSPVSELTGQGRDGPETHGFAQANLASGGQDARATPGKQAAEDGHAPV